MGRKKVVNGNYVVEGGDTNIWCDPTAPMTITLPATHPERDLVIKDISGGAGVYPITIVTPNADLIDGEPSTQVDVPWMAIKLVSDNFSTNWFISL